MALRKKGERRWREARARERKTERKRQRTIVATSAIYADLRRFPVAWPIFSPRVANPLALPVSRVTSLVHFCACADRFHRESSSTAFASFPFDIADRAAFKGAPNWEQVFFFSFFTESRFSKIDLAGDPFLVVLIERSIGIYKTW